MIHKIKNTQNVNVKYRTNGSYIGLNITHQQKAIKFNLKKLGISKPKAETMDYLVLPYKCVITIHYGNGTLLQMLIFKHIDFDLLEKRNKERPEGSADYSELIEVARTGHKMIK